MSRRAKRDVIVIDDDDATNEQPAENIVKNEQEQVVPPIVAELQQKLIESNEKLAKSEQKFKRVCEMAGEHKTRVEFLENLIDNKGKVKEESMDEKVSDLTKQLEAEKEARARDSERIAQLTNQLEEERIGKENTVNELRNRNSELTNQLGEERRARMEDRERIAQLVNQLEEERIGREDTVNELRNMNIVLTNQMEEELRARMEDRGRFEQQQTPAVVMEPLPNEADLTHNETQLPIVDDLLGESLFGFDMNFMEDPIINYRNSTPIEKESLNNISPSGENVEESAQTEMTGKANDSMEEEEENDGTVHHTSDIPEDSTDKVEKKMRPRRASSRLLNFIESLDESEPVEKKPRIKSEKKMDNKRRSDIDAFSSAPSKKGTLVSKINHEELECPKCAYRSLSAHAWCMHLHLKHSTSSRELSLALLCECGHESFSDEHSRKCDISKITIVPKNSTPKCVMCEIYPKTACGYAYHLLLHHKTTLKQMGIFLICSCGYKLCSHHVDPEHTKKCNGHEYTLHKLDEE